MSKTALITGASGGIGYEFAKLLAQDGYNLVLIARSEDKFYEIKQEFREKFSVKVMVIPVDLTIPQVSGEIFHELEKKDIKVDVLINNAGFGHFGEFQGSDLGKDAQMIQLNIVVLTHLTKLFLKGMIERGGGKILNVASVAAFLPGPLMSVYYATKAYVLSFSEAVSNETKGTGVTVTALCPGPTETGFQTASQLNDSQSLKNRKLPSAAEVAKYGYKAMLNGDVVAVPGVMNKIFVQLVKFLPRTTVTELVRAHHKSGR